MKGEQGDEKDGILRSKEGDLAAFEELIRLHQPMVRSITYRFAGSLADADDLTQEAFIRAWQGFATFRGESAFGGWLRRIAVNVCLQWRSRQRPTEVLEDHHLQSQVTAAGGGEKNSDPAARVREAVQALPPKQRAAIILTIYNGLNHAEAAAAMGCSETTISWRVFMARKRLARELHDLACSSR
jgi:RNA polymerase sigma-70 factor, ECF subfamily